MTSHRGKARGRIPAASLSVLLFLAVAPSRGARAQKPDDAALAKELQNPVADLLTVPLESRFDIGSGRLERYVLTAQAVVPFELSPKLILVSRTLLPMVHLPQQDLDSSVTGLGDTNQSFFFAPKDPLDGWVVGVGPILRLPTATDAQLGARAWGAGPTAVVLRQTDAWTFGLLTSQVWSFVTRDGVNVNQTMLQPFVSYTAPSLTTIGLSSESEYDWVSREWTVPLELGVSQLVHVGGSPLNLGVGFRSYLDRPSGGPTWGVTATVTLLFAK